MLLNRRLIVKTLNTTHYEYVIKFKPETLKVCNIHMLQNHSEVFSNFWQHNFLIAFNVLRKKRSLSIKLIKMSEFLP